MDKRARRTGPGQRRRGPAHAVRSRRPITWKRGLLAFGVVVLLLVGASAGYAWHLNSQIHRVAVRGLTAAPAKGVDMNTENILLVGSTSRCALKVQNPAYGLCSEGVTGVNSDVIMVLHLDPAHRAVSILSIPRDLFVPNARASGAGKIDNALADGPTQLVNIIQQDFGIPIQHYVELNFDTFANVVDALGGINMYFPEPVFDAYSGLRVVAPGCLHLDGIRALQVVRARHLQYRSPDNTDTNLTDWPQEAQSDLARIRRNHEFLRVLATAVSKKGLGNPLTDRSIIASVAPQLTVDAGLSASAMISTVLTFHSVNVGTAPQLTIPIKESSAYHYYYQGSDYGNVEFPSQPLDQQVVDQFLGLPAGSDTMHGGNLPPPDSVTVSVVNGTGAAGQATTTSAALHAYGFQLLATADAASVGPEAETIVYYASPANEPAAQVVARSLSGAVLMVQGPTTQNAQVTVVTGSDFSVNPPPAPTPPKRSSASHGPATGSAAPPPTGSTGGGSTGAGSAGAGSAGAAGTAATGSFSPPTPATEALAPWDPRSCTPNGGAGA